MPYSSLSSNIKQKGSSSSSLIILVVVLVALCGYLIYKVQVLEGRVKGVETVISGAQPQPEKPIELSKVKALFTKGNVAFGDAKKKVLFVEFADPSCPYCHAGVYGADEIFQGKFKTVANGGTYLPPVQEMKKLVDEGKAGYVWVYAVGHRNGEIAAQALYCANDQGKFWDVHNLLYSKAGYDLINNDVKNDKANAPKIVEYLASVVDGPHLQSCLDSGKYSKKLDSDMQVAQDFGFQGTPMFVVNTKKFAGAYSFAEMQADVTKALN